MNTMGWVLLAVGLAMLVLGGIGVVFFLVRRNWREAGSEGNQLIKRIARLPWRDKLRLAAALTRDRRIPLAARLIPPGLILYLAIPLDLIPDFIPVIGYLDDLLVVGVGVALLLRFAPKHVLLDHVVELETERARTRRVEEAGEKST